MKKIIVYISLFFSILTFSYTDILNNYNVDIYVNKNGSLHVIEKIEYITSLENKHGIIRFLPFQNNGSYFKMEDRIRFSNLKIYNENKKGYPFVKKIDDNSMYLKVGSPDDYLKSNNIYTYIFEYDVYNVLRTKDDITQLYYNVIGQYFDMPILNVFVNISGIDGDIYVYTGSYGENKNNYILTRNGNNINIRNKEPLSPYEGMTFKLNSTTFDYTTKNELYNKYMTYKIIFIAPFILAITIISIIFGFILKNKYKDHKSIIINYDTKLSPNLCAILNNSNSKQIIITIFSLMSKGYITNKNGKYILLDKNYEDLNKEEEMFCNLVTNFSLNQNILKSDRLSVRINEIIEDINLQYVSKNSKLTNFTLLAFFELIICAYLLLINIYVAKDLIILIPILLLLVLNLIHSFYIKKITTKLQEDIREIKGYKKYLEKVEAKEIEKFKDEDEVIKYFKKILPYMIAFDLEKRFEYLVKEYIKLNNFNMSILDYLFIYEMYSLPQIYDNLLNDYMKSSRNKFNSGSGGFSGGSSGFSGGGFSGGGGSSW